MTQAQRVYTHIIVRYDRVNRYSTEVVYDAVSYTDAARTMRLLMRAATRT